MYPSVAALLERDPDLSYVATCFKLVAETTPCWGHAGFLPELDCCMCSSNYLGNGLRCEYGQVFNDTEGSSWPYCQEPVGKCLCNGTYDAGSTPAAPRCGVSFWGASRAAADAAVTAAASNNSANCGPAGTCPLERLKGTFSLPSNKVSMIFHISYVCVGIR